VLARPVASFALAVTLVAGAPAWLGSSSTRAQIATAPSGDGNAPTRASGPPRAPRIASYSIDATLDHAARTITGSQVVTWTNATAKAADTLRFHLYYNAWRDANSTWMRERSLSRTPPPHMREEDRGWIEVTSIQLVTDPANPRDLTKRLRFISPDDDNPDDRTVAEIPLEAPVAPGATIEVRMSWTSRVPRPFARTGAVGSYYFIAHWFPKIGVLEDGGWNCHQFHASTEFFSDFGSYDVRLTLPRGWIAGATGVERERQDQPDGTTRHRYVQADVHDFTWTASPDYLVRTETFVHPTLPPVAMRLLLQPEHAGQEARHFESTRAALRYYGEWFGAYPYGHITIVDPAWQSGAGGMEYPTIFTAGTRWLAPARSAEPEAVTVHEAGHQFWHGIVASNEFEHAWLDEGLNTFSESRVLDVSFGDDRLVMRYFGGFVPWVLDDFRLTRRAESYSAAAYRHAIGRGGDTPSLPSWQYSPRTAVATTYHRTALWLHTLEKMLGWETLQRILSTYFQRWSYRHPKPEDFFAIANEVSGRDLTWFFDHVHRRSHDFDYGIETFRTNRREGPAGSGAMYRSTVVVRRYGEGTFPVAVKLTLDNGEDVRWDWDGRERWKLFEIDKPTRARRVEVDPDRVLMLDVHRTNNSAAIEPDGPRAARRWSLVWLIWLQDQLLTYGGFV
jgi:hypothetical protein